MVHNQKNFVLKQYDCKLRILNIGIFILFLTYPYIIKHIYITWYMLLYHQVHISYIIYHILYITYRYIIWYIYHMMHDYMSHDTYTICDMPPYHITHVLLRSHVLACIPYWQVWPHVLVHIPEQPFDISFHTMQVGIEK